MKEVSKDEFYSFFADKRVETGCPSTYKIWQVKQDGITIARAEEIEQGVEKYLIAA